MPVDLRWGLTKEDTSATGLGAIEYCLREVDASRPFFLMMEGERYGWVPPEYKVSDRQEFEWVKQYPLGHAITEMELLHGFLRKPYTPVHAVVYARDPSFIKTIENVEERRVFEFDYDETTAIGKELMKKRNQVRAAIRSHAYCKFRNYACNYKGKDKFGKIAVTGLSAGTASFARMVLCDLYEQIAGEFQVVDVSVELEQQQRLSEEAQKSERREHNGGGSDGGLHSSVHKNVLKRLEKMGQRIKTLAKTMTLIEQVRFLCLFFLIFFLFFLLFFSTCSTCKQ